MSENDGLEQILLSRQDGYPGFKASEGGPHLHEFPLASEPRFGRASDSMEDKETELLNSMSLSSYACYPSAR